VPGAYHTAALGFRPEEFRRRVLAFFAAYADAPVPAVGAVSPSPSPATAEDAESGYQRTEIKGQSSKVDFSDL